MEAGKLRHVVTLERRNESQLATGEVVWNWVTWQDNVRAAIEDLSTREQVNTAQVGVEATTRIRIRFRPGVTEKMRVKHVTEVSGSPQLVDYYDIMGVTRDLQTQRTELQLLCVRRSSEGFNDGNVAN